MTAAEEVFAELGYHEASVDEVVRRSGTSKGAIYFHFPSKEALFFALVDRLADSLARSIQEAVAGRQGAVNKVDAALLRVFSTLAQHRRLARILLARGVGLGPTLDRRLMAVHQRFAALVKSYLDEAMADGSIAPIDTELTAYAWLGAINEIIVRWLHTGQPAKLEDALPALRRLLLGSIGARVD
jgi:AcrR family transcriptional regulator